MDVIWEVALREGLGLSANIQKIGDGTVELSKLRPDERRKIDCGVKHFRDALGVDFQVATDASDLGIAGSAFTPAPSQP